MFHLEMKILLTDQITSGHKHGIYTVHSVAYLIPPCGGQGQTVARAVHGTRVPLARCYVHSRCLKKKSLN